MADQFDYRLLARGVDPIKLDNPLDNALAAAKVQGAQSQNALAGAQAQQAQRTVGIQNELDNFDGSDPSKLSRPAQKQFSAEQSAQKMAALDRHMKVIEAGTQLAQGATDQASWDAFRQEMAGYDPKAAQNIPAQFDPATRDAFVVKGLSVKDSFANQMKMMEMQSKDADRQEMMNYRRDMLGIAQQNANSNATRANSTLPQSDVDPETVDRIAHFAIANGGSVPAGTYAFGRAGNPMRDAVNNRITAIQKGDTGQVDWSQKAGGVLQNKADLAAQRKASVDFGSGAQGKMLNANHTAVAHIDAMNELVQGLNNGQFQTANDIKNYFLRKTGDGTITSVDAARGVVGKEIMNAIVAGGGGIGEREEAEKNLSSNLSLEQWLANTTMYKDLMGARNNSLVQQGKALGVNEKILNPFGNSGNKRMSKDTFMEGVQRFHNGDIEEAKADAAAQGYVIDGL